jgi:hypothetical protein
VRPIPRAPRAALDRRQSRDLALVAPAVDQLRMSHPGLPSIETTTSPGTASRAIAPPSVGLLSTGHDRNRRYGVPTRHLRARRTRLVEWRQILGFAAEGDRGDVAARLGDQMRPAGSSTPHRQVCARNAPRATDPDATEAHLLQASADGTAL